MDTLLPIVSPTLKELISDDRVKYDAQFSACGLYRPWLSRTWDANRPYANFLMLNPSKATHLIDDNTVFRTMNYAFDWGYGGVWVTNIFDFRETDPEVMKKQTAPCSPQNDAWIVKIAKAAGVVVCAWGVDGDFMSRGAHIRALLLENGVRPMCLKLTKNFHPSHPLYLKKTLIPIPL
jgi:hypothetical protein